MVREIAIEPPGSPLIWIPNVFRGQSPLPRIDSMLSMMIPVVQAFGTEKMGEMGFAEVQGALGGLEVLHNAPLGEGINAPRCRIYTALEFWHDDTVSRSIRPGYVVRNTSGTGPAFPFVALGDAANRGGDPAGNGTSHKAIRLITVGPGMQIGARAATMGAGARLTIRVAFFEFILGQYATGVF